MNMNINSENLQVEEYISIKEHRRRIRGAYLTSFLAATLLFTGLGVGYSLQPRIQSWLTPNTQSSTTASGLQGKAVSVTKTASASDGSVKSVAEQVGSAVVTIETTSVSTSAGSGRRKFAAPFPSTEQTQEGMGSGFIISKDGLILTNNHVVDGANSIQVRLLGGQKPFKATVIGADKELDLAVLKIEADKELPVIAMGDSNAIFPGDWVVAIGNPYGLDHTVTAGVISAKGRPLTIGDHYFKDLLQTDASINPGNSGGPLLNLKGEVIGINTAINAEGQGLGFAIPMSTVQEVLQELISKGKVSRPWLGVSIQDMTSQLARYLGTDIEEGILIAEVVPDSPASKGGLEQGDIILEINKQKVKTSQELSNQIDSLQIGQKAQLLIWRNGSLQNIVVSISEK